MTDEERLAKIEGQIDYVLSYQPEGDEKKFPLNGPLLESLLRCRQILKDGSVSFRGYMTEPPESWQK